MLYQKLTRLSVTPVLFLLLLFGGLGVEYDFLNSVSVILFLLFLLVAYLVNGKLFFPRYFNLYLAFSGILIATLPLSVSPVQSFKYTLLFSGAGFLWLITFNFRDEVKKGFETLLLVLGLAFGLLYLLHSITGTINPSHLSLFMPITSEHPHNHIGDMWSVVMVVLYFNLIKKRSIILYASLFLIGILFLLISQSRSAYISVLVGTLFLTFKDNYFEKYKKTVFLLSTVFLFLFFLSGTAKSIFFNRPYYFQSVMGFFDYPFGVGLGNFGFISHRYNPFGLEGGATYAFSLLFEVLSGLGIFSLVFYLWIYRVIRKLIDKTSKNNLLASAVFVTIGVNFLFDYTYFIPTMLWLWFLALGVADNED